MQQPNTLLAMLSKMAQKPEVQFDKLFQKLYNIELWLLAYQSIAPKQGNMTPGVDGKTIDGAGMKLILETIADLKAAHEQDRAQVGQLAAAVQEVSGQHVELAFVDQGDTGDAPAQAALAQGMRLEVVRLPEAKRGFVLLPRRWVVERSFAWTTRFRRLARDYERWPQTRQGLDLLAFVVLMLHRFALVMTHSP